MLLFLYKLPERKEKMFIIISNGKDALIKNGGIEFDCHLRYEALSYEEEWKKIKEKINNFYVSSKLNFFYRIFETVKYCMKLGIQIDFLRIETKRNLQYKNIKELKILAKEFPLYVKTFNIILERTPNSLGVEERRIKETEFGIEIRRSEKDIYVKLDKIEVFDVEKLKGIARFLTENDRKYGYFSPLDIAEKIIKTVEKIKKFTMEASEIQIRYATIKKISEPLLLIKYLSFVYDNKMVVISENELRYTTLNSKFMATLTESMKKFEPENIDINMFKKIEKFNPEQPYEVLQEIRKTGKTDKIAISFIDKENSAKNIRIG